MIVEDDRTAGYGLATGILFHKQNVGSVADEILNFERREQDFLAPTIRKGALRFDSSLFHQGFLEFVRRAMVPGQRDTAFHLEASAAPQPVRPLQ